MSRDDSPPPTARLARAAGVDPRGFRALIKAYLLMDLRNQQFARATGTKHKEVFTPLFWIVAMNVFISFVASTVLFGRVDAYFFALVGLSISMVVTATSLIVEFNEVVLSPDDLDVIGHQPVPPRTYAAARVANLMVYLLAILVSTSMFPAIVGMGLRDTSLWYLPAYSAAALFGNLAIAGLVIWVYALASRGRPNSPLQEYLAWAQAVLMAVTFYGGQFALRDRQNQLEMFAYQPPDWISFLPSAWLAAFVDSTGSAAPKPWILAAFALFTVVIWALVMQQLSAQYAQVRPGQSAWRSATLRPLPEPGQLLGRWARWWARSGEERAGFWLCRTMLRRDPSLRLRSLPMLSMIPAALLLGYFTQQLTNPFQVADHRCVLTLAGLYLLPTCTPAIFYNMQFSPEHEATWVLETAPVEAFRRFTAGMRRAVICHILAPVMAFVFVVLWIAWKDPVPALVQVAVAWLVVLGTCYWCDATLIRRFPFSQPVARGQSLGPVAPYVAAASMVTMTVAGLHYVSVQVPWGYPVFAAGVAVATVAAGLLASRSSAGGRIDEGGAESSSGEEQSLQA